MPHPFANVYFSRSAVSISSDYLPVLDEPDSAPLIPSLPPLLPARSSRSSSDSPYRYPPTAPGHFVKHTSKVTLLLNGQDANVSMPVYSCGTTVDGVIAVPRPSALLALDVKVQGLLRIQEIGEGGTIETELLGVSIFSWDSQRDASFPAKVSFRYTIPKYYLDEQTGERFLLPPTYEAELPGIPGFNVDVSYKILVNMHYTRPTSAGPFPRSPSASPAGPQTLFTFTIRARHRSQSDIEAHVFLPASQVCTLQEPIPFFVTLFADEASLAPFTSHRLSLPSFHPLSSTEPVAEPQPAAPRTSDAPAPISMRLQRTTVVDVLSAGLPCAPTKSHIFSSRFIGQGVVQRASQGLNSMTWAGTIAVDVGTTCGAFVAGGLKVSDSIVLSVSMRDGAQAASAAFCEAIPVRLTTRAHGCSSALRVSEWT